MTLRSCVDGSAPVARATQSPFPAAEGVKVRNRGLPMTDQNWEIQPEGLTRLLTRLQKDYTGPKGFALYVTENGCPFVDVADVNGYAASFVVGGAVSALAAPFVWFARRLGMDADTIDGAPVSQL